MFNTKTERHIARASIMQLSDDQENDLEEHTEEEIENESQSYSEIDSSESSDDTGYIVVADTHLSNSSSDESNELNHDNRPDDS